MRGGLNYCRNTTLRSNIEAGKSHGNVDALSRRPCPEDCKHCTRQESKEVVSVGMLRADHLSNEWKDSLQRAQQEDPDIKPILEWMKASAPKPKWSDVSAMSSTTKSFWAQWDSCCFRMEFCAVNGKMFGETAVICKWLSLKLRYRMFYSCTIMIIQEAIWELNELY
ncbi:unnamed protein product [Parnassius apollo]|uniref:(apollo) hypothetical protein n=1 Tax=Parnassius apollo TaxID=110799 RepID=A0A8S3XP86_PARAO|nr:unnamed protein product [Parnassius apollo]